MSTVQTRSGLILPDDGGAGGDDIVDVTTQLSNSIDWLSNAVGVFHVANAGALPSTGNFVGRLAQTDDNGAIYQYSGSAWVFHQDTRSQESWMPTASVAGGTWTYGAGANKYTRYYRVGTRIWVDGWVYTGTTGFGGGTGSIRFTVPYKAMNIGSAVFWGSGTVNAHGEDHNTVSRVDPGGDKVSNYADYLDTGGAPNRVKSYIIQNADGGGAPGTGIPRFPGAHTFDVGFPGYINWSISYIFDITQPVASA